MSSPNAIYWSTIYNYFASSAPAYNAPAYNTPAYPQYPPSPPETTISGTPDLSTAESPSSQSSVTTAPQEVEVGAALYFPEEEGEEGDGGEREGECDCGFDFCDGFCEGLAGEIETGDAGEGASVPGIVRAGIVGVEDLQANDIVSPNDMAAVSDIVRAGIIESNDVQPYGTHTIQLDGTHTTQPDSTQPFSDPAYDEFNTYCYLSWQRDQEEQAALDAWVGFCLNAPDPQGSVDSIPCRNGWERRVWGVATRRLREGRGKGKGGK